jgi:glycosyltransferase involved in cell wall biosynthesis
VEILGVCQDRITNTYQAVSIPADLIEKLEDDVVLDIEETLGLGWHGYFLYFGAVEPKKNLARLIEAHLTSKVDAPLVIVGGRGWLDADENAFLEQLASDPNGRGERIRRFPYMPFHLLVSLIRGARGVLFPSLYEGFGLPVLEAMLLGAPVITSNAGSLPEVAGSAALSVDPYDVGTIRDAIRQVDADASIRNELSRKGQLQARQFSPENYASAVSGVYERLGV